MQASAAVKVSSVTYTDSLESRLSYFLYVRAFPKLSGTFHGELWDFSLSPLGQRL